jgi:hypothetical protein
VRPAAPSASPAGPGSAAPAGAEAGAALPDSRAPTPPPPAPPPPPPAVPGPKAARLKRMVRLAAELLLLLGLLLLTLHITVLRGSGAADGPDAGAGNSTQSQLQVSAPRERGVHSSGKPGGGVQRKRLMDERRRVFSPTEDQLFVAAELPAWVTLLRRGRAEGWGEMGWRKAGAGPGVCRMRSSHLS